MRTKQIIFFIGTASLCIFFCQKAQAQPGNLPSEQVEVIKIFEAQLAESEKVPLSPELPPTDTSIQRQQYDVPERNLEVEYLAPRIRPVAYNTGEEVPDVYKAYAKLGGGLPASLYGEGSFNTMVKRSDKSYYRLGLDALHHSANFSNDEVENQKFSFSKVKGHGTYYFEDGYALDGRLGYTSEKVHYYGYNFDPFNTEFMDVPAEAIEQVFGTFEAGASFFNGVQTAGDINYNASIDLYTHGDSYAANETGLDLKGKLTKWIAERHSVDLGIRTDFTWYRDTSEFSQTLHNFTLSPAFTFHGSVFRAKLGGKIISNNDEFELFPDLEAVINLTGNELAIYAGLEGDLQKNTFRSLSDYNPFIYTRFPENTLRNTKYFRGYAGVRGNLKFFDYTFEASYKPTNDLALYKMRFEEGSIRNYYTFDVVYDDVDIINISGSIKAVPLQGLELTGTISQNIYETRDEDKPWHLPSLEVNFLARYVTKDNKFRGKAQLFLQDGVTANSVFGIGRWDNLNGLYDISLGAEYWFVKHFGAFLDINNLLDNERERWRYYPTYGLNVLGGITLRF